MKSHGFFVYYGPPNFLLPSLKEFSLPCHMGTAHGSPWLQTPNCNYLLLILNKPIFVREITVRLFVVGQHIKVG